MILKEIILLRNKKKIYVIEDKEGVFCTELEPFEHFQLDFIQFIQCIVETDINDVCVRDLMIQMQMVVLGIGGNVASPIIALR